MVPVPLIVDPAAKTTVPAPETVEFRMLVPEKVMISVADPVVMFPEIVLPEKEAVYGTTTLDAACV
jgi:hypothetical protein